MLRRTIVVGDAPACGGQVLPYSGSLSFKIHGYAVALIGGRAYCEGCHSVGIIAKAGGPRRVKFISEVALEGDVVMCQCPTPQPLVSKLQATSHVDDGAGMAEPADAASIAVYPLAQDARQVAASKKVVDEDVTHPPEAEQTENICPNMTNREFCNAMLDLRDKAIELIANKRLSELERWNESAQARVREWFGTADAEMREYLRRGLTACVRVLRGLDCKNFVRLADSGFLVTCTIPAHDRATVAMVCKPDISTRTIAIALSFCGFRPLEHGRFRCQSRSSSSRALAASPQRLHL